MTKQYILMKEAAKALQVVSIDSVCIYEMGIHAFLLKERLLIQQLFGSNLYEECRSVQFISETKVEFLLKRFHYLRNG